MSYEAWGDDDDGMDEVRQAYAKTLLEDGWLNEEQANALHLQNQDLVTLLSKLCYHVAKEGRNPHLWAARAMSYLQRNNLLTPLRDGEAESRPPLFHDALQGHYDLERDDEGHPIARRPNKPQGSA